MNHNPFFSDVDEDDDYESVESEVSNEEVAQVNAEDGPDPKWYEFTSEEDDDDEQVVVAPAKRAEDGVIALFDMYDFAVSNDDFTEAHKVFSELAKEGKSYVERYDIVKMVRREKEKDDPDMRTVLSTLKESVGEDEVLQRLAALKREEFPTARHYPFFRQLIKSREDFKAWLDDLVKKAEDVIAGDNDETSEKDDEASLLRKLRTCFSGKGRQSSVAMDILKKAEEERFSALAFTAKVVFATHLLNEESRRAMFVPVAVFQRAYDMINDVVSSVKMGTLNFVERVDKIDASSSKMYFVDSFEKLQPLNADSLDDLKTGVAVIPGGLNNAIDALYSELLRMLQGSKIHDAVYSDLIAKENDLSLLADTCYGISRRSQQQQIARTLLGMIGLRSQAAHAMLTKKSTSYSIIAESISATVDELARIISPRSAEDAAVAVLYRIYHLAISGNYQQGKDLLLRSGVADDIGRRSGFAGLLFNRVLAQLGLAAFATGRINDCHETLTRLFQKTEKDVYGPREILSLIGQDIALLRDLPESADQIRMELACKDILIPPHFHLQYVHLEIAASVSAMLVDSVAEARRPYSRQNQSALTKRLQKAQENQVLTGPPTSVRDIIIACSIALKRGECTEAVRLLGSSAAWKDFPSIGSESAKDKVLARVKEDGLRIFCFTYACSFSSLSVAHLKKQFDLSEDEIKCIVNQTLLDKDAPIVAFWDETEDYLMVDRGNTSRLQHLVDNASTKLTELWNLLASQNQRGRGGRGRGRGGRR